MNNKLVSVRDNSIDIAKGIGIFLVVIGHCMKWNTPPVYTFMLFTCLYSL